MTCAGLSDILYPDARRKFVYRVFVVAVRTRVILYADNIYVHYVNRHVRFVPHVRSRI